MKNIHLVFTNNTLPAIKEVIGELHAVELERKLRLPDPTKAMEGVWKLLRRTRQQLKMTTNGPVGVSGSSSETLVARKMAKIEAERQKARGTHGVLRNTFR